MSDVMHLCIYLVPDAVLLPQQQVWAQTLGAQQGLSTAQTTTLSMLGTSEDLYDHEPLQMPGESTAPLALAQEVLSTIAARSPSADGIPGVSNSAPSTAPSTSHASTLQLASATAAGAAGVLISATSPAASALNSPTGYGRRRGAVQPAHGAGLLDSGSGSLTQPSAPPATFKTAAESDMVGTLAELASAEVDLATGQASRVTQQGVAGDGGQENAPRMSEAAGLRHESPVFTSLMDDSFFEALKV